MKKTTPAQFAREVKQEASRVTWPSRKETLATTAMVLVMVAISAVFFLVVNWIISSGVDLVTGV